MSAVRKVISKESLAALDKELISKVSANRSANALTVPTPDSQYTAVTPKNTYDLNISVNTKRMGYYKQADTGPSSSPSMALWWQPFDRQREHRNRVGRIYQPAIRHVQSTPRKKRGDEWHIEFESWGVYKSPLMHWGRASQDSQSRHSIVAPSLHAAISYCIGYGWGYDVLLPRHRWHQRKSYADNFKWKGNPKEREEIE